MTKLLSAKELLEVVRTAQADVQAAGGSAKWPPRMALGGRSGPRRRAAEQARERDAKDVAPPRRTRAGTTVMEAVTAPRLEPPPPRQVPGPTAPAEVRRASAPVAIVPPPAVPAAPAQSGPPAQPAPPPLALSRGLPAPPPVDDRAQTLPQGVPPETYARAGVEVPPAAPSSAPRPVEDLPPASAILAAMRAKSAAPLPEPLPVPREPEPLQIQQHRLENLPGPPSGPPPSSDPDGEDLDQRRRARTEPMPSQPPRAPSPGSAAASLAAMFGAPAPRAPSFPSEPPAAPVEPPPPPRPPAATSPDPAVHRASDRPAQARRSSPPLPREEAEAPAAPVSIELPDLEVEVRDPPPRSAPRPSPDREPRHAAAARREKAPSASAFSALSKLASAPVPPEPQRPSAPAPRRPSQPAPPEAPAVTATASAPAAGASAGGAAAATPPAAAARAPGMDLSWIQKPDWAPASASLDDVADVDDTEVDSGSTPVALSQDETIVLLNYDATDSLEAISQRTGFSVFKVERIVDRLMAQGVFEDLPAAVAAPEKKAPERAGPASAEVLAALRADPPPSSLEGPATVVDPAAPELSPDDAPEVSVAEADEEDEDELDESIAAEDTEEAAEDPDLEANYRKLYETKLALLGADERAGIATTGSGAELFALAFDKDPAVLRPLMENEHFFVDHARFAAFHHATSFGLERLATRNELLKDPLVQRRLLRNAFTPELVVRRILGARRLLEVYKITNDRDVPDRQRMVARGTLRQKFTSSDPEERLQLLWNTEARALTLLSGCAIDSKTTALFCARPVVSLLMVQNFAKFGATPPGLLHHFLKQNVVKRQIPLRNLLLRHPNCPSEAKKAFGL